MSLTFAPHLHRTQNCCFCSFSSTELSPLFSGGEGEIRTMEGPVVSVTCRFHVAHNAKLAENPLDHCTPLHAGPSAESVRGRRRRLNS
jgi:hypothetical protein